MAENSRHFHFVSNESLRQYFLDEVSSKGAILGIGSYGHVIEVEYRQISCAAKQMNEMLVDPGNHGVQQIIEKYRTECEVMAGLRHPNITQFLGLCFLEDSNLPLLVMERLEMSVDDLLKNASAIPLPVKISILTDTCSGLVYLHNMNPVIVHRDLTARNVLLTSSLTAKIADFGNSRMVKPDQQRQTLTKFPGTIVYMPPEAFDENPMYGPSLDMFSFGHLSLFVLIQDFPCKLLQPTFDDPQRSGHLIGRIEVERRSEYMKKLEHLFRYSYPALVQLVNVCLSNKRQTRPSSQELLKILQTVKSDIDKVHGGNMGMPLNIASVVLLKEARMKEKTIKNLQVSVACLEAENRELKEKNDTTRLKAEKAKLTDEIETKKTEKLELISCIQQLQDRIDRSDDAIHHFKSVVEELEGQLLKFSENECQLQVTFPLQLDWKHCPDMPLHMDGYIQAVDIDGVIYVGGGWTHKDEEELEKIVMAYDMRSSQWHCLSPYMTRRFGMAKVKNKLVLIGGVNKDLSFSFKVGEWQSSSQQWTHPFPPMPTARLCPSAIAYKNWLVVAGGRGVDGECMNTVEILDVGNSQWSIGSSTPEPCTGMKSTTIGNTWYLLGGWNGKLGKLNNFPDIFSVSLEVLVSNSAPDDTTIWTRLPSPNTTLSCPLNIGGSLLSLGGMDNDTRVSTIRRYIPEINAWVPTGTLKRPLDTFTCLTMAGKVYIIGGYDHKKLKDVFSADIC